MRAGRSGHQRLREPVGFGITNCVILPPALRSPCLFLCDFPYRLGMEIARSLVCGAQHEKRMSCWAPALNFFSHQINFSNKE